MESRVIPPIIDEMEEDGDGEFTVTWEEKNPNANPSYFQLDELADLTLSTDDAESGKDHWIIEGFDLSMLRSHSSSHSFKSRYKDQDVSSMTSVNPIPISEGMNLSFWCWYDIEVDYDFAFVEVSKDGRIFDVLDKFTDSSGGWKLKQYSLDNYIGESVFIRIRYITDDYTQEEGFYIDDISPIAEFGTTETLSDTITENYYEITDKSEGRYFYRVRGYNSAYEWGDFSTIEDIFVEYAGSPEKPDIDGPKEGKSGIEYNYTFVSIDPESDDVFYYIDWSDGTIEEWIGPYQSGEEVTKSHTWSEKGTFIIQAKSKDTSDHESDWSEFEIVIPRNRQGNYNLINVLLERFPNLNLILKLLIRF